LARSLDLKGYILNRGNAGVRLVLQGDTNQIDKFIEKVEIKKPEISYIESINMRDIKNAALYNDLEIKSSEQGRGVSLTLPPDIAICDDCISDMKNSSLKKYYKYPFIACAVCGPRFTTVKDLPYDRERTTMIKFPFCKEADPVSCIEEYTDSNNRRFHAQTFACSVCGPKYTLYNKSKEIIVKNDIDKILEETSKQILDGKIVAIKGIGGVHLVCLAEYDDILIKLRERKGKRKNKPFALMIPKIDTIQHEFYISNKEKELLTSFRRPIVLLERRDNAIDSKISQQVAPGLNNVGIMLAYSGIHYLLFDKLGNIPLVYTSGNRSSIPMSLDNEEIFTQLNDLADIYLLHNRPIHQRADDSVLRIHDTKVKLIRRSRGYVPEYISLPFKVKIPAALAVGPELTVTGAVLRRNRIFPTQHIGNVTHLETYNFLNNAIFHMKRLLQINDEEIQFITCDAHPAFITTKYARELSEKFNIPLLPIQHHYAHALGLMAENKIKLDEEMIAITTDGVGYAEGNKINSIWGGEILRCSYVNYEKLNSLEPQPMIGGDRCTKYPARMLASILLKKLGVEEARTVFQQLKIQKDLEYGNDELNAIISLWEEANGNFPNKNIPFTSSTGRIFDTVSYLLGACKMKTYRGEPAMKLEALASRGNPENVPLEIEKRYLRDTSGLILDIIDLLNDNRIKREDIASKVQLEIAKEFAKAAIFEARFKSIPYIGLTGGVAYNYSFSTAIRNEVKEAGLTFLEHDKIPPGDAGISIGQLIGGIFKYNQEG
ncbi:MAG: carbamoyltransferase HypF, partial [Promethearchaeota archaeon]